MRIGCCAGIEQNKILADIGYDFIELPLAKIMEIPDNEFLLLKDDISSWQIKPEVCNVFFPASLRLTGPNVDFDAVTRYVESALARASQMGVEIIVFGSAGAKNVPVGFQKNKAYDQIVKMLKEIHPIAKDKNIVIAIEPLNRTESNLINTTREGLELVRDVDCDNIRLLIDYYHFKVGMENLCIISEAASHLVHVHIARPLGRAFPTDVSEDEYEAFFEKLYSVGYEGRVSVEGITKDFKIDATQSLNVLKSTRGRFFCAQHKRTVPLCFSTLGNPDWSFDKTLSEAQRLGFDAIEIRGIKDKLLANEIIEFLPENLEETKRKLIVHNLKICGFGTSVSFHDKDRFATMIEEGKTAIDVCVNMNIPFIRVFGDKISSEAVRKDVIKSVVRGIRELCAYAEDKNIKVLLEVHGDFNTIENVMDVVNEVKDRDEFGILWDIAHSDRGYGDDYVEFYEKIKPYIFHVHIKDHLRVNGNYKLCLIGDGDIPIKKIVKTLQTDGYTGYFSFEWEKRWHPELPEPEIAYPAYVEFMKNL